MFFLRFEWHILFLRIVYRKKTISALSDGQNEGKNVVLQRFLLKMNKWSIKMDKIEFPYIDHRISQESMEDAKDNIFFHLLPYIVAQDDDELKKYKAMISFDMMRSIADEDENPQLFLKYRSKAIQALKSQKNITFKGELFDIYKYEYEYFIKNGGNLAIIYGFTYGDIKKFLRENIRKLMMLYFFILTLLRLNKYASNKYSIFKTKQIMTEFRLIINEKEDFYPLWGTTNVAKNLSIYLSRGHLIFGYIQALINHNIIKIDELKSPKELFSEQNQDGFASFTEEKCYTLTPEIVGYALYVKRTLEKAKHKNAKDAISFISMGDKALRKFGFKEIEPIIEDFSKAEKERYVERSPNKNTARHKKGENPSQ